MSAGPDSTGAAPTVLADSVTALPPAARGAVLVSGSHGGRVAARYAADAGVRAAVFNDAGYGLDDAGVAGVHALDAIGCAAAAVSHRSARIADAADTLERGTISCANRTAQALGVAPGMDCREAVRRLATAMPPAGALSAHPETRFVLLAAEGGRPPIVGLDSIGGVVASDAGAVLVIGSHGALHGGSPSSALPVDAAGAFFHDAGVGCDGAGITRLPVLDERAIPAATVDGATARIGDARSLWVTGVLSHVNATARRAGLAPGQRACDAARRLAGAPREGTDPLRRVS